MTSPPADRSCSLLALTLVAFVSVPYIGCGDPIVTHGEDGGARDAGGEAGPRREAGPRDGHLPVDVLPADGRPAPTCSGELRLGTFNLEWAFDEKDDRSRIANQQNARDRAAWLWKAGAIAKVIARERPDILGVEEIGGPRELADIAAAIVKAGGPRYATAWVRGTDTITSQQVALLSRYPIKNARRYAVRNLSKHLAADVVVTPRLGDRGTLAVFVAHFKAGYGTGDRAQRVQQARVLKPLAQALTGKRAVILLGDFNATYLPSASGYATSGAGILAGADTAGAPADDCADSATFPGAQRTLASARRALDRVFACKIKLLDARAVAQDLIIRGPRDRANNWSDVPVDRSPFRDVSDHYFLLARVPCPR